MRLRVGLDDEGEVLQVLGSEFAGVERDASPAQAAIAAVGAC